MAKESKFKTVCTIITDIFKILLWLIGFLIIITILLCILCFSKSKFREYLFKYIALLGRTIGRLFNLIFKGNSIFYVNTRAKVCALTIDDAPSKDGQLTHQLLDILQKYEVRATFFIITGHIMGIEGEAVMRRIVKEGHEIGNHMDEDRVYTGDTEGGFRGQLIMCENIIQKYQEMGSKYYRYKWFRPPSGRINKTMAKSLAHYGYKIALGDAYTNDPFIGPNVAYHISLLQSLVKRGSIIILHSPENNRRMQTLNIVDNLIPRLLGKGYKFVTLSELLDINMKYPTHAEPVIY